MEQFTRMEQPGMLTRLFFRIGERMFGKVPTPERLMAKRMPLMLGIGGSTERSSGSARSTRNFARC